MTVEIISRSISTKVWDRAGIELATPGSAVRLASVARHVTDCTTRPGNLGRRFGSRLLPFLRWWFCFVDKLFNVLPIVCGSSVFVFVLLCITLCLF